MDNDMIYLDSVPEQRIVFAYTMRVNHTRTSVSPATTTRLPADGSTRVVDTEQAAFFAGADQATRREAGCRELLEALGEELRMLE